MVIFSGNIQVKAVIFDFDGVIVDTEPLHFAAFQKLLEPLGLGFTWDQYVETYMGFDDRDAFREAFRTGGCPLDDHELQRLIAAKALLFQEIIHEGVKAYPGVVELIRGLKRASLPLAICSGALRSDILPILKQLSIDHCFDTLVSAEDVTRSKPHPQCYQLAFQLLRQTRSDAQFSPDETVAIEDTPAGISAATQAGLRVIAVTNSYPQDQLGTADHAVTSLEGLINI